MQIDRFRSWIVLVRFIALPQKLAAQHALTADHFALGAWRPRVPALSVSARHPVLAIR